jgi:carbon-monoxide dehydrogenase small subunit
VNDVRRDGLVEPRRTLADFLREDLELTGTHVGCEHGGCGACTVLLNGAPVFSCLLLAGQAAGQRVTTVEGLAEQGQLNAIQQAFWECHAMQCGFCTPGFLISAVGLLRDRPDPSPAEIRTALSGNLCRCTGYQNIIDAVTLAARRLRDAARPGAPEE